MEAYTYNPSAHSGGRGGRIYFKYGLQSETLFQGGESGGWLGRWLSEKECLLCKNEFKSIAPMSKKSRASLSCL